MPYATPISDNEIVQLIASKPFGQGTSREVFEVPTDPAVVVKKLKGPFPGSNFIEWFIWTHVKETDLKDVLGKCITISETATYLMMERLDDISDAKQWEQRPEIPEWLSDAKVSSFGINVGGAVKMRDYAGVRLDGLPPGLGALLASARRRQPGKPWTFISARPS